MSDSKRSAVSVFDRLGNRNADQNTVTDARSLLTHKQSQSETSSQPSHPVIEYRKTNKAPIAFHFDANSGPSSGLLKRLNTGSPCANSSFSSSGESGSCSSTSDIEGNKIDRHLAFRHQHQHHQQQQHQQQQQQQQQPPHPHQFTSRSNRSSTEVNRLIESHPRPPRAPNVIREVETEVDLTPPHLKDRLALKYDRHGNLRVPLATGSSHTRVHSKSPVDSGRNNRVDSPSDYKKYYDEYHQKSKPSDGPSPKYNEPEVPYKSRSRSRHYELSPIEESSERRIPPRGTSASLIEVERFQDTRIQQRTQQIQPIQPIQTIQQQQQQQQHGHHYYQQQHHMPVRDDEYGYRKSQSTSSHRVVAGDYSPVHSHGSSSKRGSRAGSSGSANVTASSHRQGKSRSLLYEQGHEGPAHGEEENSPLLLEKCGSVALSYKVSSSHSQSAHLDASSSISMNTPREMKPLARTPSPVSTLSLGSSSTRTGCVSRGGKKRKRRDNQLPANLSVNTIQSQPPGHSESGSTFCAVASSHPLAQGAVDASPFSGGSSIPEFDEFDGHTDALNEHSFANGNGNGNTTSNTTTTSTTTTTAAAAAAAITTSAVATASAPSATTCIDLQVGTQLVTKKAKIEHKNEHKVSLNENTSARESSNMTKRNYDTSKDETGNYSDWSEGEIGSGDEQEEGELGDEDEESLNEDYYFEEELDKTVPKLQQYGYGEGCQYGVSSRYIRSPRGATPGAMEVVVNSANAVVYRSASYEKVTRPMRPTSMKANHEKVVVSSKQSDDLDPISDDELDEILGDSVDASRVGEAGVKETASADETTTARVKAATTTDQVDLQSQAASKGASCWQGEMFDCLQIDWASLIGDMDRSSASLPSVVVGQSARSRFSPLKILSFLGFSPHLAGEPLSSELIQLTSQLTTRELSHLTSSHFAQEQPCNFSVNILHDETSDAVTTALASCDGTGDPPQATCLTDDADQALTATDDNNSCEVHAKLASSSLSPSTSTSSTSPCSSHSSPPCSSSFSSLGARKNSDGDTATTATATQPILSKGEKEANEEKSREFSSVSPLLLGHALLMHKRKLQGEFRVRKQPESLLTAAVDERSRQLLSGRRTTRL